MSKFLTKELAEKAYKFHEEEMLGALLKPDHKGYHVTILNPAAVWREESRRGLLEYDILFQISMHKEKWTGSQYEVNSHGKAVLSLREKMASGDVPRHCLRAGDIHYGGSVYYRGIIVSVSGYKDQKEDERYSLQIAQSCEELAREAFEEWHNIHSDKAFV